MRGRVAVGEGMRPQGVKGALRVRPWLEDAGAYERIGEVFVRDAPERRLEVESLRRGGKGAIVWKFKGVNSPEEAEALRGAVFLADREALRRPGEEVLYWEDFEGLDAVDETGALLGRIEDNIGTGSNDVLVIRTPEGGELLVPALREVVLRREGNKWVIRPPRLAEEDEQEG